jgi:toxin ParE1/3/4
VVTKYYQLFDAVYQRLETWPASGPVRPRLGKLARIAVVTPYVMIYDWNPATDTITIVRIVRGSRRITRKLVREW